jgi:hypothetical protein
MYSFIICHRLFLLHDDKWQLLFSLSLMIIVVGVRIEKTTKLLTSL